MRSSWARKGESHQLGAVVFLGVGCGVGGEAAISREKYHKK